MAAIDTDDYTEYSILSSTEESFFLFGILVIGTIGITLSVLIIVSLCVQREKVSNLYKRAWQFAIASNICSLAVYLHTLFLCNDLFVSWDFDDKHKVFVANTDLIFTVFYFCGKVTFYISFTHHILSVFDKSSSTRTFLTLWMIGASVLIFLLGMACAYDESILEQPLKEIGVTEAHGIHLAMVFGHEGTAYEPILSYTCIAVDMVYFLVLMYFYVKKSGTMRKENAVKGLVLVLFACVIMWFMFVMMAIGSVLKWFTYIDLISDDICLFLMFESQNTIYRLLCGKCDTLCSKCIDQKGYVAALSHDEEEDREIQAAQTEEEPIVQ